MYSILEDLKSNTLKRVYLLYGTEQFLVRTYREKLVYGCMHKSTKELAGDMNFARFTGPSTDVREVNDFVQTMPFFAERRLVVLDDTQWFQRSDDDVAELIANIPDTATVLFVEDGVDKRTNTYKAVEKNGYAADFEALKEEDIKRWICREVDRMGKKITNGAVAALMDAAGDDLGALKTELDKVGAYCLDKEAIERADVEALTNPKAEDRVFEMMDLIGAKRRKEALDLYNDLLELRESPIKILSLMERHFKILIAVKDLRRGGLGKNRIADRLGLKPFRADRYMAQSGNFTMQGLKEALADAAEYDKAIKSGGINERMAVEMLIVKHSSKTDGE